MFNHRSDTCSDVVHLGASFFQGVHLSFSAYEKLPGLVKMPSQAAVALGLTL